MTAVLVPAAGVDGVCRGHAEAVFAPGARVGTWDPTSNPLRHTDGKDFGLSLTLDLRPASGRRGVGGTGGPWREGSAIGADRQATNNPQIPAISDR